MLFIQETVKREELNNIQNFFNECDTKIQTVSPEQAQEKTNVSRYLNSLISGCYQKAVEDIENTSLGNKVVKRRNLQQIMQESFFYGANKYGNNFIA